MKQGKARIPLWSILLACLLSALSTLGFIYMEAERSAGDAVLREYRIEFESGSGSRIVGVWLDGEKKDLSLIRTGFQTEILGMASAPDTPGSYVIRASRGSGLRISFLTGPDCGRVAIHTGGKIYERDLSAQTRSTWTFDAALTPEPMLFVAVSRLMQPQSPKLWYALYFVLCWALMLLCVGGIRSVLAAMKRDSLRLRQVAVFVLCSFAILLCCLYAAMELLGIAAVLVVMLLALFAVNGIRNQGPGFIRHAFVLFAASAGILMLLLLPPTHVLDEYAHFVRAYELSFWGGDCHVQSNPREPGKGENFIALPESFRSLENIYYANIRNDSFRTSAGDYLALYATPLDEGRLKSDLFWFGNTHRQPALAYLPGAAVITALRLIGASPVLMIHLGRFANLLLWILMGYWSLSILPRFSRPFLLAMLLPVSLQQSFGYNMDWLTNAFAFLLTALILREAHGKADKPFGWKEMAAIFAASVGLMLCKLGYIPLILLILLIPHRRFAGRGQEVAVKLSLILACAAIMVLQFAATSLVIDFKPANLLQTIVLGGDRYSLAYLLRHPLDTVKMYVSTFLAICFEIYHDGLLMGFGWYARYANDFINSTIYALYFLFIISGREDDGFVCPGREKAVHLSAAAIIALLVFSSMLLTYTPFGSGVILGIQPRYFIPCMALLYIAAQNRVIQANWRNPNIAYAALLFFALTLGVFTIAYGYYMPAAS